MKFGFDWPIGLGEDVRAFWTDLRWTYDGRTPEHGYDELKSIIFYFSYKKQSFEFDLALKRTKVNPGSLFEHIVIRTGPQFYIPSLTKPVEIGPVVLGNMFEGLCTRYVRVGHHGHVTRCREQTFVVYIQGRSTQNLTLIGQAVLEKMFEHCRQTTNGRQSMGIS